MDWSKYSKDGLTSLLLLLPNLCLGIDGIHLNGSIGGSSLFINDTTMAVTPTETDSLKSQTSPFGLQLNLGLGYDIPLRQASTNQWFNHFRATLNYYYFSTNATGDVYQYQYALFNNYSYDLNITSNRLMLDGYLYLLSNPTWQLFAIGGFGESWNTVRYSDSPRASDVTNGQISLNSQTNSGLAGEIGAGISVPLQSNISLYAQYLYTHFSNIKTADMGRVAIYRGTYEPINVTPARFTLAAQTISIGFDYKL